MEDVVDIQWERFQNLVAVLKPGGRLFVKHIDQPAIGSHPLRRIRRQLERFFSSKHLASKFENYSRRSWNRRFFHWYVLRTLPQ